MEINRFEEVMGVVPTADIVEGRMVLLTTHTFNYDFGSRDELPGVKVPATAEEANAAKFCITWANTNAKPPFYQPQPALSWALRQGFDQAANAPFSATVYATYPGYQDCVTIPSGTPSLAFGEGTYTVPSGCYIADASWAVGSLIQVGNTAEDGADAGKLKRLSAMSTRFIGIVEYIDSTTKEMTFRIK